MNTERHEELAALAALDLLSPPEQAELATALAQNPGLQILLDSLRETSAALALTAPAVEPPAALKARLLAHISVLPAHRSTQASAQILEFENSKPKIQNSKLLSFPVWPAWAAAASFALAALWFGQSYFTAQQANQALLDQQTLSDLTLRSTHNQLEAERLIAQRELADAALKTAGATRLAAALQARVDSTSSASSDLASQLARARTELSAARNQLADLDRQLKTQGDLANYKIAALASLAGNTPQALAVAVWNPASQQGVLSVQKLPALATDKDYQLWVFDQENPAPISGGTFTVDPVTGEARVNFHPKQSVKSAQKFAISLERKGGSSQSRAPDGPVLFLGQ